MDKIKCDELDLPQRVKLKLEDTYRSLVGSLNWLPVATRSDIATITNILLSYIDTTTPSNLATVKHVIQYLKGSTYMGISFSTKLREKKHAFIKFPVDPSKIVSFTDANWGPQDVSIPKLHSPDVLLKLF